MITSIQELTDIELRVIIMSVTGHGYKLIAEDLNLSEEYISDVINSINRKCNAVCLGASLLKLLQFNII